MDSASSSMMTPAAKTASSLNPSAPTFLPLLAVSEKMDHAFNPSAISFTPQLLQQVATPSEMTCIVLDPSTFAFAPQKDRNTEEISTMLHSGRVPAYFYEHNRTTHYLYDAPMTTSTDVKDNTPSLPPNVAAHEKGGVVAYEYQDTSSKMNESDQTSGSTSTTELSGLDLFKPLPPNVTSYVKKNGLTVYQYQDSLVEVRKETVNVDDAQGDVDNISIDAGSPVERVEPSHEEVSEDVEDLEGMERVSTPGQMDIPPVFQLREEVQPPPYDPQQAADEEYLGQQEIINRAEYVHHINWLGYPLFCETSTSPETSLTIIMTYPKKFGLLVEIPDSPLSNWIVLRNALCYIDPVIYCGAIDVLHTLTGSELQEAVTGYVRKYYSGWGSWDQTVGDNFEEMPLHDGMTLQTYEPQDAILNGWYRNHSIPTREDYHQASERAFNNVRKEVNEAVSDRRENKVGKSPLSQVICVVEDESTQDVDSASLPSSQEPTMVPSPLKVRKISTDSSSSEASSAPATVSSDSGFRADLALSDITSSRPSSSRSSSINQTFAEELAKFDFDESTVEESTISTATIEDHAVAESNKDLSIGQAGEGLLFSFLSAESLSPIAIPDTQSALPLSPIAINQPVSPSSPFPSDLEMDASPAFVSSYFETRLAEESDDDGSGSESPLQNKAFNRCQTPRFGARSVFGRAETLTLDSEPEVSSPVNADSFSPPKAVARSRLPAPVPAAIPFAFSSKARVRSSTISKTISSSILMDPFVDVKEIHTPQPAVPVPKSIFTNMKDMIPGTGGRVGTASLDLLPQHLASQLSNDPYQLECIAEENEESEIDSAAFGDFEVRSDYEDLVSCDEEDTIGMAKDHFLSTPAPTIATPVNRSAYRGSRIPRSEACINLKELAATAPTRVAKRVTWAETADLHMYDVLTPCTGSSGSSAPSPLDRPSDSPLATKSLYDELVDAGEPESPEPSKEEVMACELANEHMKELLMDAVRNAESGISEEEQVASLQAVIPEQDAESEAHSPPKEEATAAPISIEEHTKVRAIDGVVASPAIEEETKVEVIEEVTSSPVRKSSSESLPDLLTNFTPQVRAIESPKADSFSIILEPVLDLPRFTCVRPSKRRAFWSKVSSKFYKNKPEAALAPAPVKEKKTKVIAGSVMKFFTKEMNVH